VATVAESVTKDGSAFQTRASATGKARSPIVILRVGGTTSADLFQSTVSFLNVCVFSLLSWRLLIILWRLSD